MPRTWFACLLAASVCVLCGGCSRQPKVPWGTAEGRVLLEGQPVSAGSVVFENLPLGVSRMAELEPDGSFVQKSKEFPGLPAGKYRVAVTPLRLSKGDFVPVGPPKPNKSSTRIPTRFHSVETSELSAEVREGRNEPFVFILDKLRS